MGYNDYIDRKLSKLLDIDYTVCDVCRHDVYKTKLCTKHMLEYCEDCGKNSCPECNFEKKCDDRNS